MSHLTTHILDATAGTPASGVEVTLHDGAGSVIASGRTDEDGRLALGPDTLEPGTHTLTFATGRTAQAIVPVMTYENAIYATVSPSPTAVAPATAETAAPTEAGTPFDATPSPAHTP